MNCYKITKIKYREPSYTSLIINYYLTPMETLGWWLNIVPNY